MPGTTFNAADIVNKTLIASRDLEVFSDVPSRNGKKIGTVKRGNSCGVVYSWITDSNTGTLYWVFKHSLYGEYCIEHAPGSFNVSALREQGVITTQEKIEKEEYANLPWYERLFKNLGKSLTTIAIVGVGVYALSEYSKSKKNG